MPGMEGGARGGRGSGTGRARERIYDAVSLALLAWPATGGMWLMGSTRTWGFAPGLALSFIGILLVAARPLAFPGTARWRLPPGLIILAALAGYAAVQAGFVEVPAAARWEALRWASLAGAAFAWTQAAGREHRWKWLLAALLMAAALNGLYAIVQHANGSRMVLWAVRAEQYGMRASGTYLCPNHLANALAMLVPVSVALLGLKEAGFPLRAMTAYFLAIAAPVMYWTQSRSGWLGMAGGLCATLLLLAWRRSRAWFFAALVALPLAAAALGWTAWKTLPGVRERIGPVLENPEKAGGIRMQMWRDAPAMIRDRPIWGFGGGSFVWAYPPYQRNVRQHLEWDYLHNDHLQLLLEHGAAGAGLALGGLLACGWGLVRGVLKARSRAGAHLLAGAAGALVASLLHAIFDFNFHIFPNPHVLVWVGGVAWGTHYALERGLEPAAGWRRAARQGIAAGLGAACLAGAWLAIAGGTSYWKNLRAEMAREALEWDGVEELYRSAAQWDPLNWQPHLGLGKLKSTQALWYRDPDEEAEKAEKSRLSAEAIDHYRRALELNPFEMAAEYGLARSLQAVGDSEGALEHYRRAAAFQRRHVFYREQLGIQLRRMGRDEEALETFRQNVADGVGGEASRLNVRALEKRLAEAARQEPASDSSGGMP